MDLLLKEAFKKTKSIIKKSIGYDSFRVWALRKGIHVRETRSATIFRKDKRAIIISKKHAPYRFDMVNFFEYYFNSVESTVLDKYKIVDYSSENYHVLSKTKTGFYFSSLPESDFSTETYIEKLNLQQGDVVFDLGAYCGATSYFFSQLVGDTGKIISVEADLQNYRTFLKNIQLHNLSNVVPLNNYVWHKKDMIVFNSEGNMGSTAVQLLGRNDNTVAIESLTLEDLLEKSGGKVDAIKIDIEGAELDLIARSESFFSNHHPKLMIEPHIINDKLNTEDLIFHLEKFGYKCELLKQDELHLPLIFAC